MMPQLSWVGPLLGGDPSDEESEEESEEEAALAASTAFESAGADTGEAAGNEISTSDARGAGPSGTSLGGPFGDAQAVTTLRAARERDKDIAGL
jgi:hypothetical protein